MWKRKISENKLVEIIYVEPVKYENCKKKRLFRQAAMQKRQQTVMQWRSRNMNHKGFTLVEVMVSTLIAGIFLSMLNLLPLNREK